MAFIKEGRLFKLDVLVDERLEGESLRTSPPNGFILVGVVSPHQGNNQTLSMTLLISATKGL